MKIFGELIEGLRIAGEALWANKLRAGLATLGIVIGVMTVTLMGTALDGMNQAFLRSISAIGTDVLFVHKYSWFTDEPWWKMRNRRDITLADGRAVMRQFPHAEAIAIEAWGRRSISYQNRKAGGVTIVGTTEQGAQVGALEVKLGRFFSGPEVDGARPVCLLGSEVAENFFPQESPLGQRLKIQGRTFEIIGVLEKRGKFLTGESLDNQVLIPITRWGTEFTWRPDVIVKVKVGTMERMEESVEELRGILRKIRRLEPGQPDDFAINEQQTLVQSFNRVSGVIASVALFVTGLSLFVGGIGIMNIMFVSVAERTREIGIRKAIGAKRRAILAQFLLEAAAISLLGGLIGLALAFPLTQAISHFMPARLSPGVVGAALGVSMLAGVLAGFFPAWRAAKMDPVEALRNE